MSTNSDDSRMLNQTAAHDTGLYDESRHDNQIVAMYENDARARTAMDALEAIGIPAEAMHLVSRDADLGQPSALNEKQEEGLWGSIRSLFVPDSEHTAFSHALGRGHAMLIVHPGPGMDRKALVRTLEGTEPVDFDARLEEWRQAGYDTSTHHSDVPMQPAQRQGTRERPAVPSPVRSYIADRMPDFDTRGTQRSVESRAAEAEALGNPAPATAGETTSGGNAPRR